VDPEDIGSGVDREAVRKWRCLQDLLDRNETLFYSILQNNFTDACKIVYTPVVGWAAVNWHRIYRRPRGMYVSAEDRGCMAAAVWNWPEMNVDAIVVTDGSRILGLGDLGCNGLAIPIGKLNLYVAAAGFHPARVLPIVLDVGTDNGGLRSDPAYMGLRRGRLRGDDYFELLDELVAALTTRWPRAVLQFEDLAMDHALASLRRYRHHHLVFNDDIQGTAATAVAGMYGALQARGLPPRAIKDQTYVVLGAGSAGMGVVSMLAEASRKHGATAAEAASRFWVLDARGLVTRARGDLSPTVAPFARPAGGDDSEGEPLASVVARVAPDALIGLSGAGRLFTRDILADLAARVRDPVVFPLSNPTAKMECLAADAHAATGGRAIFASGSPQPDMEGADGRRRVSSQANNLYIFPGLALGAHLAGAATVSDAMLTAAAEALPPLIDPADLADGAVYPRLSRVRQVSMRVAAAVMRQAADDGTLRSERAAKALDAGGDALEAHITRRMYQPMYTPIVKLPRGVME